MVIEFTLKSWPRPIYTGGTAKVAEGFNSIGRDTLSEVI
jgi:hypothetical protein